MKRKERKLRARGGDPQDYMPKRGEVFDLDKDFPSGIDDPLPYRRPKFPEDHTKKRK